MCISLTSLTSSTCSPEEVWALLEQGGVGGDEQVDDVEGKGTLGGDGGPAGLLSLGRVPPEVTGDMLHKCVHSSV
jgi:hypothetical protein